MPISCVRLAHEVRHRRVETHRRHQQRHEREGAEHPRDHLVRGTDPRGEAARPSRARSTARSGSARRISARTAGTSPRGSPAARSTTLDWRAASRSIGRKIVGLSGSVGSGARRSPTTPTTTTRRGSAASVRVDADRAPQRLLAAEVALGERRVSRAPRPPRRPAARASARAAAARRAPRARPRSRGTRPTTGGPAAAPPPVRAGRAAASARRPGSAAARSAPAAAAPGRARSPESSRLVEGEHAGRVRVALLRQVEAEADERPRVEAPVLVDGGADGADHERRPGHERARERQLRHHEQHARAPAADVGGAAAAGFPAAPCRPRRAARGAPARR